MARPQADENVVAEPLAAPLPDQSVAKTLFGGRILHMSLSPYPRMRDGQREHCLPRLATGELIAAFCLTEACAGSDAAALRTTARRETDGRITAFIVEAARDGVGHGHHEDKMGIRASSTTTVRVSDVRVPAGNVLSQPGKGFKISPWRSSTTGARASSDARMWYWECYAASACCGRS